MLFSWTLYFSNETEIKEMLLDFNNLVLKKLEMTDNNIKKIRNEYSHMNIIKQYINLIKLLA